jgi:hypothetical protein
MEGAVRETAMVARNRASRKRATRVEGLQNRKRAVSATRPSRAYAWRARPGPGRAYNAVPAGRD